MGYQDGTSGRRLLSDEQYQRLHGAAWEQLGKTLDDMRGEVKVEYMQSEI